MSGVCQQSDFKPSEWISDFIAKVIGINTLMFLLCLLVTVRNYGAQQINVKLQCIIMSLATASLITDVFTIMYDQSICEDSFEVTTFSSQWPTFIITQLGVLYMVFGLTNSFILSKVQLLNVALYCIVLVLCFPFYENAPFWLAVLISFICSIYFLYLIIHINLTQVNGSIESPDTDYIMKRHLINWMTYGLMRYPLLYILAATQSISQDVTLVCQVLFNLMDSIAINFSLMDAVVLSFHSLASTLKLEYQSTEARRGYLRYVFHDVRVPLNSIMMGLDVLSSSTSVAVMSSKSSAASLVCNETATIINMMQEASTFMMDTLNDVLSMETIEAGALKLTYNEFEIGELVDRVILSLQGSAEQKRIKLIPSVANNFPLSVIGDRFRIEHVLANLLSNSIKFSPPATAITVKVNEAHVNEESTVWVNTKIKSFRDLMNVSSTSSANVAHGNHQQHSNNNQPSNTVVKECGKDHTSRSACHITFSVIDEGPGMSEEDQKKLFVAFAQAAHKEPQTVQGTGLGLALCKHTVELHGGRIECQSKLGVGTTFSFTIPFDLPSSSSSLSSNMRLEPPMDNYNMNEEDIENCSYYNDDTLLNPATVVNAYDSKKSNTSNSHQNLDNQSVHGNVSSHIAPIQVPILRLPSYSKSHLWKDLVPFGLGTSRSYDENNDVGTAAAVSSKTITRDVEKGGSSSKSFTTTGGGSVNKADVVRVYSNSNGGGAMHGHSSTWSSQDTYSATLPYPSPLDTTTSTATRFGFSRDNSPSKRSGYNDNGSSMTPRNKSICPTARSHISSTNENHRGENSLEHSPTARSDSGYEYKGHGDTSSRGGDASVKGHSGRVKTSSFSSTGSCSGNSPFGGKTSVSAGSMSARAFIHKVQGLVVDDSRANRAIEAAFLGKRNVKCDMAENGQEAIQCFEDHMIVNSVVDDDGTNTNDCVTVVDDDEAIKHCHNTGKNYYGIIFMDRNMPVKNGLQAAAELRQKGYINLIVGLTGSAFDDEVEEFLSYGADVVFSKPFTTTCMYALIEHVETHGFQSFPDVKYVLSNEILVPRGRIGGGRSGRSSNTSSATNSPYGSRTLLLSPPPIMSIQKHQQQESSMCHRMTENDTNTHPVSVIEPTHVTVALSSARSDYSHRVIHGDDCAIASKWGNCKSESKDTCDSFKTDAETLTAAATNLSSRVEATHRNTTIENVAMVSSTSTTSNAFPRKFPLSLPHSLMTNNIDTTSNNLPSIPMTTITTPTKVKSQIVAINDDDDDNGNHDDNAINGHREFNTHSLDSMDKEEEKEEEEDNHDNDHITLDNSAIISVHDALHLDNCYQDAVQRALKSSHN